MIEYQKAKILYDLGFPQMGDGRYYLHAGDQSKIKHDSDDDLGPDVYIPTLSELITACGEKGFSLNECEGKWLCKGGGDKYTAVVGNTKEESIANLWLALHDKK